MPKVTTVGAPFLDLMSGFPLSEMEGRSHTEPGQLDLKLSPGGPASNICTGIARLGMGSSIAGKIGDDWFGQFLRRTFERENVEVSSLIETPERKTGIVFPIIDKEGVQQGYEILNESTQFELDGSEIAELTPLEADLLMVDGILLMAQSGREALQAALSSAKKEEIPVAFDPNFRVPVSVIESEMKETLTAVLERTEYLLLNENELEKLGEVFSPDSSGAEITEGLGEIYGIHAVIVKQGSRGHRVNTDGDQFSREAFEIEAVDTQGGGDSFDAGFIAGLLKGLDVRDSALVGSAAAAIVCSGRTAWDPLPTAKELAGFLVDRNYCSLAETIRSRE